MTYLLGLHLVAAVVCAALSPRLGSRVFLVGAIAPAASFAWLCLQIGSVLGGDELHASIPWADSLGLRVPLRLDGLGLLLGLLVTGIGTVVMVYSVGYFTRRGPDITRHSPLLVFFAGSMLALVLADHLIGMYVAWELTTVCSFLLIGNGGREPEARAAAFRALLVTTGAGFAMLLGLILLGAEAGSYRISTLLVQPPHGTTSSIATALVLVGALAKSAQMPFQAWLPAAMVAATPVSAYLHAAAMVKAGVYLVARLSPAFAESMPWHEVVLATGLITMIVGGWRAMNQTDLKRLLAFGTIAQLGFLLVLLGAGTHTAALAGATLLVAHALFKSALFLVVGALEHRTGTRDIRELSGVSHRAPGLTVVAVLAGVSMAGLPPTIGYLGKEAALQAFLEPGAPAGAWVLAGIVVGSAFTLAYTLRFLWGAFGGRSRAKEGGPHRAAALAAPIAIVALPGIVLSLLPGSVGQLAGGYASAYPPHGSSYHLALWHGLTPALQLSMLSLILGAALHLTRDRTTALRKLTGIGPSAQAIEDGVANGVTAMAHRVTSLTQVGSLPTYLLVMLVVVSVVPITVLASGVDIPTDVRWWDTPWQAVLAIGISAVVGGAVATRHRLSAVLLVSASGYLVAGLFVIHGASGLALVQVLVETLTLLLFVVVLRRMGPHVRLSMVPRLNAQAAVAAGAGLLAAGATLATGARHHPPRALKGYFHEAPHVGGPNVVNVIITEFRALDTLGEVAVLVVAATGIASLVLVSGRLGQAPDRRPAATPPESAGSRDGSA